ncbi:MAG: hypothetical protein JRJ39_00180 [Deltaproteobacteria bacterium]|nr:hypothetical protein [Deltaproteobacteria bacterium]MBW2334502.1 hypothetical protein [Deltaproteobacteria bacterium]
MGDFCKTVTMNEMIIQENGIIRNKKGYLVGRLVSEIEFNSEHIQGEKGMEPFREELEQLINKHSIENYCDMPDFLMADMICGFIDTVGASVKKNLDWHGCDSICHPKIK